MKRLKNLLNKVIICLTISAVLLSFSASAVTTPVESGSPSDCELLLNRIGISAVYDENAYITRGDFTVLAVQAMNLDCVDGENTFADISGEQAKYINTAAYMGYVSRSADGLFHPERIITAQEAAAICLRMLGYGEIITSYPDGYMAQASKLKLLNKIVIDKPLTGADAAMMIFNTLDTEYLEDVFLTGSQGAKYQISDTTFLYEKFGVRKLSGIISSVYGISLNGYVAAGKENIIINSVVYENPYYSGFGYYTYLGRNVEYYIKDSLTGTEVIYIKDKAEPEVIDFADVTNVKGFDASDSVLSRKNPTITYSDENGKTDFTYIKPDATVLINGEKRLEITNNDFSLPSGQITLVDTDDNTVADVVFVEQHTYYTISYFDKVTGKVEVEKGNVLFNINDCKEENLMFLSGDKQVESEILVEGAILQLMCSFTQNGEVDTDKNIALSVKTQTVEGTIEYISDDGKLGIGGKEYRVLPEILQELNTRIGATTVFYLGNENLIVSYKDFQDKTALEYGYLVKAANVGKLSTDIEFLIYTLNEEMEVFKPADEMKFTGEYNGKYVTCKKLKKENILSALKPLQLIKYLLDENGKISVIELAYDHSSENAYQGFDHNRFSLDYASDNAYIYTRYVGTDYKSNANTIYFYVSTKSDDKNEFMCGTYIEKGYNLDGAKVKIYDSDTYLQPGVVVIEDYPKNSIRLQDDVGSLAVVVNKRTGMNKEGNWVTRFDTWNGKNYNTHIVKDDELAPLNKYHYNLPTTITKISEIKNGDIIKYGTRKNGEVDRFIMINEYDKTHTATDWSANANDFEGHDHLAEVSYVKGRVATFVPSSHLTIEGYENQRFSIGRNSIYYLEYNVAEDTLEYANSLPRLTVGDYVWFNASRNEITTLVRYVKE